jgi:hypothetical protein
MPIDPKYLKLTYRLSPDSIPDLPASVVTMLKKRAGMVPQPGRGERANAVSGAFSSKGAIEWAVLCSVRDTSQILILNAASGAIVDSVDKTPDLNYLESEDGVLWVVGETVSLESAESLSVKPDSSVMDSQAFAAIFPKPIDHDAVGHWYSDKGGEVLYSANGRWYRVSRGD